MASTEGNKKTVLEKIEIVLNFINHFFIGFISIYMTYLCINVGLKTTSLHAWLCTIGVKII